jgi:pimeloyl-ACP methyl ester carboxylesterase
MLIGVAGGLSVYTSNLFAHPYSLTSIEYSPEIDAFKKAQQKVLLKYRVPAKSLYLKLSKPKLKAHVLAVGKGSSVVMLHGGGATAAQFTPLMSALQKDYHLFVPDRPGCGLTERFDYRGIPFREHAIDFVNSIFDSLHLSEAVIVANSMGGYWALVFALAHPERVTKLVLIGEPAGSSPPDPTGNQTPHKADPNPTIESIKGKFAAVLVADINRVAPEILEEDLAAALIPGAALAWDTMLEQLNREQKGLTYALRSELKNLRPPTLFIWGEKDRFGPPTLGQEMAALAPHAHCEVVSDAGHLVWLDQPDSCSELTLDFLKRSS